VQAWAAVRSRREREVRGHAGVTYPAKSAEGQSSPLSLRRRRCAWCHNVLEEVHYRVFILGPAVLRLLGQGAVVGSSRCVMSILKERAR